MANVWVIVVSVCCKQSAHSALTRVAHTLTDPREEPENPDPAEDSINDLQVCVLKLCGSEGK